MRVARTYTIEVDLIKKLEELPNGKRSDLINDLLTEHFKILDGIALTDEQLDIQIKIEELKEQTQSQIKQLEQERDKLRPIQATA